jgi:hypothetical protein
MFGRVGRNASTEVIIELVKTKRFPILFYAIEDLPFNSNSYKYLDYVINQRNLPD